MIEDSDERKIPVKIRGFFHSKCCRARYEEILTEEGKIEIRCEKCDKVCITLEEKYNIDPRLFLF